VWTWEKLMLKNSWYIRTHIHEWFTHMYVHSAKKDLAANFAKKIFWRLFQTMTTHSKSQRITLQYMYTPKNLTPWRYSSPRSSTMFLNGFFFQNLRMKIYPRKIAARFKFCKINHWHKIKGQIWPFHFCSLHG
jgi:hypothetical protein